MEDKWIIRLWDMYCWISKAYFFSFSHTSVEHITREGNCVAHKLARRAANFPFLVWMESVTPDILEVYQSDLLKMK